MYDLFLVNTRCYKVKIKENTELKASNKNVSIDYLNNQITIQL